MGTKNASAEFDCYVNALPDEPMFILLARDPSAPDLVRAWAERRMAEIKADRRPDSDTLMVAEAHICARKMESWRRENDGKWRAPPAARGDEVQNG